MFLIPLDFVEDDKERKILTVYVAFHFYVCFMHQVDIPMFESGGKKSLLKALHLNDIGCHCQQTRVVFFLFLFKFKFTFGKCSLFS
jgi:hypothetical protein